MTPTRELSLLYRDLRSVLHRLEQFAASDVLHSEVDDKRLDKGIVVLKVGAKLLKKILRTHDVDTSQLKRDARRG